MKNARNITVRWSSLLLASLMLFLAGWSHELSMASTPVKKDVATQKGAKPGTPTETKVQAASLIAVVTPASSFDFAQTAYLLPPPVLVLLLLAGVSLLRILTIPYFYFSYFRYVFGHYIAPNAP